MNDAEFVNDGAPKNGGRATHERVLHALDYSPSTGVFIWKSASKRGSVRDGDVAGNLKATGYCRIVLDGRIYLAHRLAWFYVYGEWPSEIIDHINGDRADNRIENLRVATHRINSQNVKRARSTSIVGVLGVQRLPHGRFRALIKDGPKNRHLGTFATPEEAHSVYVQAKRRLHDGCTI